MCLGAMSRGVRGARWTQIDAIARANVPCRPVERRLPCQMIFRKAWNRALTAVRGRLGFFLQITARANVPWRPVERRLPCQMNCRKGGCRACTAVRGKSAEFLKIIARADVPWSAVWRGSRCSMDTNRCHRAGGCPLEARRMAIAVPGEFHESEERVQREERVQSVQREQSVQSEDHVYPHLLPQSTRVQERRADYDLKANSKPIWLFRHPDRARNI